MTSGPIPPSDGAAFLEAQLRDQRTAGQQLAVEIGQLREHVGLLTRRLTQQEDALASFGRELGELAQLRREVQVVREILLRSRTEIEERERRIGEQIKQALVVVEAVRAERGELIRAVDELAGALDDQARRLGGVEETARHSLESSGKLEPRIDQLQRQIEVTEARAARTVEATKRTDHQFARLLMQIDQLEKADGAAHERMALFAELVKRIEDEVESVAAQLADRHALEERIELLHAERQRWEERLAQFGSLMDQHEETLAAQAHALALGEARERALVERMDELREEVSTWFQRLADHLQRIGAQLEREKRRQLEELQREIKELRTHAFRPTTD